MSKEKIIPGIIPLNEYVPELEDDVKFHVARITAAGVPRVTKKYNHIEIPDFKDDTYARKQWELEEIRRCIHGFDNLPGKFYYYFNHCKIEHKSRGLIRPDFRTIDLEWFKFVEECQKSKKYGIVAIKRRQIGQSWKAAADILHDCSFNSFFKVGMNSKSEEDSRGMFENVKLIHQELPEFLRPVATASNRRDKMVFARKDKDAAGNPKMVGTQSSIISVAPTIAAHAGKRYGKLVIDEAGEQCDLLAMWAKSEPCITQDAVRTGALQIFGTVGDITKNGKGLMELWKNAKSYDLKQFGIWGYNAMFCDDFGNDLLEEGVRYIIYKRKSLEGAARRVRDEFFQMFPLNENDAFLNVNVSGIGNPKLISDQYLRICDNPPERRVGKMRRNTDNSVDFVPDPNGKVVVYELPVKGLKNAYVAGADPADHENVDKSRDTSNLALSIVAKAYGSSPPRLVLEYVDRPAKLDEWFREAAMCLQWYNGTKVLAEDNRARMVNYFETNFPELLAMTPRSINSVRKGVEMKYGIKMTAERKEQMKGVIEDFIDNYSEMIPSKRLLEEFRSFGSDHADDDLAIAFGWALILLQGDKSTPKGEGAVSDIPTATLKKHNGVIQYVNQGKPVNQKPKYHTNSLLFKR